MSAWQGVRADRLVDACGAVSAVAYLGIALASWQPPVPLGGLFAGLAITWGLLLFVFTRFVADPGAVPLRRVVAWAVVFRLIGLAAQPVLEDDSYRYLWDGRSSAVAGSPYADAPADHFDDPSVEAPFDAILDRINHPDVPTVYAPVSQALFLISYWIAPGDLTFLKLLLCLADLATLALLLSLVSAPGVLLYAWCPLLIQETAFSGHVDSVGIVLLVAAVHAFVRGRDTSAATWGALAAAAKPFALVILPLLLLRMRASAWAVFVVVLGLAYAPFLVLGGGGLEGVSTALGEWEFNSIGFAALAALGGRVPALVVGAIAVGTVIVVLLARERGAPRRVPRGDIAFAVALFFAPTVNPWYVLWLLPFVCAYPSAWGLAALAAVSLSYAHGLFLPDAGLAPYAHPIWVRPAEIAIVLVAWIAGRVRLPMRIGPRLAASALVVVAGLTAGPSDGSGTYSARPGRAPSSMDRGLYELGKQVFAGEYVQASVTEERGVQVVVLQEIQGKLPVQARARVDLPTYAGDLSTQQMDALRYFVRKRYRVQ